MARRVFNYLSYVAWSVPVSLFVGCDVVLAMTDPPFEGIVGACVALLKGKPYVYNIRDMYPDMAVAGSIVEPGLLSRLWERLHRWALRRATRVIVLGEDMRARVMAKGVAAGQVVVVRDGAEMAEPQEKVDDEVVRQMRGEFRFVAVHAGNLGFYGAWDTLLEAARQVEKDGIGLVFVGEGAQRERLAAAAAGMRNVRFLPFFPAKAIASVLAAADAHVITIRRGLEGVVVPSKMYGILAAGKPIVAVAPKETDVATLGEQQGFGVCADPDKPAEVAESLRRLARDAEGRKVMAERALEAASGYQRSTETRKFAEIVEEAAGA